MALTFIRFNKDIQYEVWIVLCLIIGAIFQMLMIPIVLCLLVFQVYLAMFNFTSVEVMNAEKFIKTFQPSRRSSEVP